MRATRASPAILPGSPREVKGKFEIYAPGAWEGRPSPGPSPRYGEAWPKAGEGLPEPVGLGVRHASRLQVLQPLPPAPPQFGEGCRGKAEVGRSLWRSGIIRGVRERERFGWQTEGRLWGRLKGQVSVLRRGSTEAESLLWARLRRRQLQGCHFRRQHPIGQYIVDFYCWKRSLVIEIDGRIHRTKSAQDAARDRYLESLRIRVLRFSNAEVQESISSVIERIKDEIEVR